MIQRIHDCNLHKQIPDLLQQHTNEKTVSVLIFFRLMDRMRQVSFLHISNPNT